MNKDLKLIIFDCDGTLVDSEPITLKIITKMFAEMGIHITFEECHDLFVGSHFSEIVKYVESHGVSVDPVTFEDDYRYQCSLVFAQELQPIDGVIPFLSQLDIPFCIASNGPKKKMKITLTSAGLGEFFAPHSIFSAYDINKWKPEPDLFLHAAQSMGVAPQNCLVVEDTIHGINAAISANMDVVGINVRSHKEVIEEKNIPVFDNMHAIADFVFTRMPVAAK